MQFIVQNTGEAGPTSVPSVNPDPFTGAGAYVPGASTAARNGESQPSKSQAAKPVGGVLPAPRLCTSPLAGATVLPGRSPQR